MRCSYACGQSDHAISRRSFLGTAAAGIGLASGFGGLIRPAVAADLEKRERQVLLIWLHGGASQLETWDPKPGTETGGPFRSIETSVPGVRISELLPLTARQMHRMALGARGQHQGRRPREGLLLHAHGPPRSRRPGIPPLRIACRPVHDFGEKSVAGLCAHSTRRGRRERA